MTQAEIQVLQNEQYSIILDREAKLRAKDYIGVKIAMGVAAPSDYADDIAQTEQWRADINAAQVELERLGSIVPDDQNGE